MTKDNKVKEVEKSTKGHITILPFTLEEDAKEYASYLYQHSSDIEGELAFYIYKCWENDTEWYQSDMEYIDKD